MTPSVTDTSWDLRRRGPIIFAIAATDNSIDLVGSAGRPGNPPIG